MPVGHPRPGEPLAHGARRPRLDDRPRRSRLGGAAGLGLRETEARYLDAERRRVVYVAATRARDLLVVPRAGAVAPGKIICGDLLHGGERCPI